MKYEEPKMEIMVFNSEDIITASDGDWEGEGGEG